MTRPYHYFHDPPAAPYECAHRVGVTWDRDDGGFIRYSAASLGMTTDGGFWLRAFHRIDVNQKGALVASIAKARP